MKRNALKIFKVLCGIVVVLALSMAGITAMSAYAADNGIYVATATPHYRNPQTGVIEDSGGDGSEVLGQSMTESATYRKALVEVDSSGNTFVTIRLQLMDNIRDPQFQVDGASVSATLMQEDYTNNTADYRMRVNSEDSVIRCSMNVIAMGRNVIFYITVSDLTEGSGDFITSITVDKKPAAVPESNGSLGDSYDDNRTDSGQENAVSDGVVETVTEEQAAESAEQGNTEQGSTEQENTTHEDTEQYSSESQSSENVTKTSGVSGLNEYDEAGNKVTATSEENVKSKGTSKAPVIIAVVVFVLAAGGVAGYFVYKRRK